MTEGGGKLGLVVEQGKQPARDKDVARHGMGVGDRRIEHDEAIAAGQLRLGHELLADAVDVGLQGRIGIGRADIALDLSRQGRNAGARGAWAGGAGLRRIARQRAGANADEQGDKCQ